MAIHASGTIRFSRTLDKTELKALKKNLRAHDRYGQAKWIVSDESAAINPQKFSWLYEQEDITKGIEFLSKFAEKKGITLNGEIFFTKAGDMQKTPQGGFRFDNSIGAVSAS